MQSKAYVNQSSAQAKAITRTLVRLRREHPDSRLGNKRNPLSELIFIVLSGQTTESLYTRAYLDLRRAYPKWSDLLDAPVDSIAEAIAIGGLARVKAQFIKAIVEQLASDFGEVTLRTLSSMSDTHAESYLRSLPGVGVKTARCVLMYALNREVFPLDTHCVRVMTRLGWIDWQGQRVDSLADEAQSLVPPHLRHELHVKLVQHGRKYCRSRPDCSSCALRHACRYCQSLDRG